MNSYKMTLVVQESDLDNLNHVNNVRYLQWVQDIAQLHWDKNATEDLKTNFYWVVLNHHIDYYKPALLNETILIETFVASAKGVTSTRIVNFYDSNKTLLVKCETKWCFMNRRTNKISRLTPEVINLFN